MKTERTTNKLKILNDPIYGFITIPGEIIGDIIAHPYFQRLRRISQMGLSYLVYPGACHTRFHHATGCMHLMQKAISVLRFKGIAISGKEESALLIAALLHDIGHGPFSHALEKKIVPGVTHECISSLFMEKLNAEFKGKLSVSIALFKGVYHKKFLCRLISGQMDIDRLDYLKRDSFYTGVAEGNINVDRLVAMLDVKDNELVVEEKGIYSVEKFVVARRLMYWSVYLHKTSIVAEGILVRILQRVRELALGEMPAASKPLQFFLKNKITADTFDSVALHEFSKLDDYDVFSAIKQWIYHKDKVLSQLCEMIVYRKLLGIELHKNEFSQNYVDDIKKKVALKSGLSREEAGYFVFSGTIENQAYNPFKDTISILYKSGVVKDIVPASDQLNMQALSEPVVKHFLCYPKDVNV